MKGRSMLQKILMFVVFVLLSVTSYHEKQPSNVMIQYGGKFVPIEPKYVSCQQVESNGITGHKCDFSLDNLEIDKDNPKFSIWANLDDNEKLHKLTELDAGKCEIDDDDGQAYCAKKIEFEKDMIEHLDKIHLAKAPTEQKRRQMLQVAATTKFKFVNKCSYDLTVSGAMMGNNIIPPMIVASGQTANAFVSGGLKSCRLWAETDCGKPLPDNSGTKTCDPNQAPPTVSLFEWSTDDNGKIFYDISQVDAANIPISVYDSTCGQKMLFNPNLCQTPDGICSIQNLWDAVPNEMKAVDQFGRNFVNSICQTYKTPSACCTGNHTTAATCGVIYNSDGTVQRNDMTEAEESGLGAMHTAFPQSYSYAYDDKIATGTCQGGNEFTIGLCANCDDANCGV